MRCLRFFFCQAEDGIRDLVRSRGLGDVYKRQAVYGAVLIALLLPMAVAWALDDRMLRGVNVWIKPCLLYTSDAADERSSVDLGGRRIIKKKTTGKSGSARATQSNNKQ